MTTLHVIKISHGKFRNWTIRLTSYSDSSVQYVVSTKPPKNGAPRKWCNPPPELYQLIVDAQKLYNNTDKFAGLTLPEFIFKCIG